MDAIIENYLFQHKFCPLPSVGTLYIRNSHAVSWHSEKRMSSPVPEVVFEEKNSDAEGLVHFIAASQHINITSARVALDQYCSTLRKLSSSVEFMLPHTGKFIVDAGGELIFQPLELPAELHPSVDAVSVKHHDAVHYMTVGNNETTTAAMSEYYSEQEPAKADKWWVWAIVFFAIAATCIAIYFSNDAHSASFGNATSIHPAQPAPTYKTGK